MKNNYSRKSFLQKSALAGGALAAAPLAGFGKGLEDAVQNANLSSRPSDLRITDCRVAYVGSRMFVILESNQGIEGHGEAVDSIVGGYHLAQTFGRRVRGENPLDVHRIFENIRTGGVFQGAQSGMYIGILSAIETALWDLSAKALDLPLYQLLGGKFRDRLRVYVDTALYQFQNPPPEQFAENIQMATEMGFTAIKYDIDQANDPARYDRINWTASPGELARMEAQIGAAREAAGPNFDICVDGHGRYDLYSGKKIAKLMEPFNLMWLEEPVPAENPEAYRIINEQTNTPLAAGENHFLAHGLRPLLEMGAVDVVMPDLQKAGGLGEGQRIANLAHLHYIPFAPHMVASFLGAMAQCHVCASVPNFMILEWQTYYHTNPMWEQIVNYEGNMVEDDGYIRLREEPGIGVTINVEGMREYASNNVPFFESLDA